MTKKNAATVTKKRPTTSKSKKRKKTASKPSRRSAQSVELNADYAYIGSRCRKARESLKISREEIAEACEKTKQQIYYFEQRNIGSLVTLFRYLNYLYVKGKINPAWIFLSENSNINMTVQTFLETHALINSQMRDLLNTTVDFTDSTVKNVNNGDDINNSSIHITLTSNPSTDKDHRG